MAGIGQPFDRRVPLDRGLTSTLTVFISSMVARILGTGLLALVVDAQGQTQPQVQFVYDAAGNLVQITRSVVTPKPDLTVSALTVGVITSNANGSYNIPVSFRVNNVGTDVAPATWYDRGYLSANSMLHDTDQALGGFNTRPTSLGIGAAYVVNATFVTNTTTSPGAYTLIVKADGGTAASGQYSPTGSNAIAEADETNNTQSTVINIPIAKPDLTISNVSTGAVTVAQNGAYSFPVTYTVTNVGGATAPSYWWDVTYLSSDGVLDNGDLPVNGTQHVASLAPSASYTITVTNSTLATTVPGTYTLFVKTDGNWSYTGGTPTDNGRIVETSETNNVQAVLITLPTKPDLTVSNVSTGAVTVAQNGAYSFPVTYTVTNVGGATAQSFWWDVTYLSSDGVLDNGDLPVNGTQHLVSLAPGASYTITVTNTTLATTVPGTYTLFVKADGNWSYTGGTPTDNGRVVETNETNNVQPVLVALPSKPDLTVSNASVGTITVNQNGSYTFPVTYTVTNIGGAAALATWWDLAYLSVDGVLDNKDVNLSGYRVQSSALASGASYTATFTYSTSPTTAPGNYTLFIKADGHGTALNIGTNTDNGNVTEANETNNTQALALTLPTKPDLTVSNASVGTITVNQNGSYTFPVTYTVTNIGGAAALASWWDLAYLSADGVLDSSDVNLNGYRTQTSALASGASYTATFTYSTSATTAPGNYTLFIKADGHGTAINMGTNTDNGSVAEANEGNNTQALALTLPSKPDLTVSNISIGTIIKNANQSYSIPVTYTVTNSGGVAALPNWFDLAYLSVNVTLDNSDLNLIGYRTRTSALSAGGSYTTTFTYTTTTTTLAGSYTLFIKADGHGTAVNTGTNTDNGAVSEGNESNNTASISVVLP